MLRVFESVARRPEIDNAVGRSVRSPGHACGQAGGQDNELMGSRECNFVQRRPVGQPGKATVIQFLCLLSAFPLQNG